MATQHASITDWFIPNSLKDNAELMIRARTVVGVALLAGAITPLFALSYFKLHHPAMGYGILLGGVLMFISAFLLRLSGAVRSIAQCVTGIMFAMVCWMVYVNGGIHSTSLMWFACVPFAAIFLGGKGAGYGWAGLCLAAIWLFFNLDGQNGTIPDSPISLDHFPLLQAKSLTGLLIVVLALALAFENAKTRGFQKLEQAREEAETARQNMGNMFEAVTRSIRDASRESKEIADSAHLMVTTMKTQSKRTQAMVQSVQHMSAVTETTAQQSAEAANSAQQAGEEANVGGDIMRHTVVQLDDAQQAIQRACGAMDELGRCSSEISSIVDMIRGIAEQTNLLALNAAIEASRAGEQGRGFAVVADEVRKLAERTTDATADIGQKISLIVTGTEQAITAIRDGSQKMMVGTQHAKTAANSMDEIIGSAQSIAQRLAQVSAAEQSQSNGFKQFSGDMNEVGLATETLSHESDAIAAAIRRLDQLMRELGEFVRRFELDSQAVPDPYQHLNR